MDNRKFGQATANSLFRMTSWTDEEESKRPWVMKEDGVHINEGFRTASPADTAFDWTPAYDMDWPGSPDPQEAPLLPIPFTANELAACLLDGLGCEIQQSLDERIGYALDDEALAGFSSRQREVRDALRDAYALAAKAQLQVGEFDYDEERRAQALTEQWSEAEGEANAREGVFDSNIPQDEANRRRARAVASVADLQLQSMRAEAAVKGKWLAWRKAMVRQLLGGETRQSRITQLLDEMQTDEYKQNQAVCEAAVQRVSDAEITLQRREALLSAPENLGGISGLEAAEAAVQWARRELENAKHAICVMRGDFGDSDKVRTEQGPTQAAQGDVSNLKNEADRQAEQLAFCNVFLDLEHWAAIADVSAREAAMLLSLHNPTKIRYEDAKTCMHPDLPDGHLERLDRRLTDYGTQNPCQYRRLLDWYLAAQDMEIKLSPEAQEFMGVLAKQDAGSSSVPTHNLKEPAASRAPESATLARMPEWSVKKPRRYGGYTAPLHALLCAAHREGKPPPTAHEVLEAWRVNKPPEIDKVLADGFDYYGGKDGTKTADLAALRAAIKRATSAR